MDTNTELYSKGSVSLASMSEYLNVIPDPIIIPISWWWMTNGFPVFSATENNLVLASGYASNEIKLIEGQVQKEVRLSMFETELFKEGVEKSGTWLPKADIEESEAWHAIEDRVKTLVQYAIRLGMFESLRFYGVFARHMGLMSLGCSNIPLGSNPLTFDSFEFVEKLPKSFKWSSSA